MASGVRKRLEQAIRDEEEKIRSRRQVSEASTRSASQQFEPVRQAAEELREQVKPQSSIAFTINPDSVWITLADRDTWFSYDTNSRQFIGEECAHSWYDGEAYADRHQWDSADACIEAMIRLCASYIRMARAIDRGRG